MVKKESVQTFEQVLKEIPFNIKDASGVVQSFVMREITGDDHDKYASLCVSKTTGSGESARPTNVNGIKSCLLSKAIFAVLDDGNRKKVEEATILAWPMRTVEDLFDQVQELNGLGDYSKDAIEKAKNDLAEKKDSGSS